MKTLPGLKEKMVEKGATRIMLAEVAGISEKTLGRMIQGIASDDFLVDCVVEALETREFRHIKKGPKGPWKN